MKKHIFLFSCLLLTLIGFSQTIVPGGYVSGAWIYGNSPYEVTGDIVIAGDSVLMIAPGVVVEFQGHYKLEVQGQLLAQGALGDSIVFTIQDTTGLSVDSIPDGGWGGIRFEENSSTDTSRIEYCKVQYGKVMYPDSCGGGIYVNNFSKLVIENSNISYNRVYGKLNDTILSGSAYGGGIYIYNCSPEIINNNISSNVLESGYYKSYNKYIYIFINTNGYAIGGGICLNKSNSKFVNNSINNNWAGNIKTPIINGFGQGNDASGGGIALINSNIEILNSKINNNVLFRIGYYSDQVKGGGIYSDSSSLIINNNEIINNAGLLFLNKDEGDGNNYGFGGGMYSENSSIEILNSNISKNQVNVGYTVDNDAAYGGGIYISGNKIMGKEVKIINNIINNNNVKGGTNASDDLGAQGAEALGGGVYIENVNSLIEKNIIDSNNVSGGGDPINFESGSAYGGGICAFFSCLIINNYISYNSGNIVGCCDGSYACGGGIYLGNSSNVINNVIVKNELSGDVQDGEISNGSGIYCGTKNRIINNTICFNEISEEGCGDNGFYSGIKEVYCYDTTNILINNVIWGKDTCSTFIHSGKFSYCDVEDTIKGIGNINQKPLFDSTSTNPYSLLWSSPCIGKGSADTTGLMLPQTDIVGNPRVVNGRVDMGAYEYQGEVNVPQLGIRNEELGIEVYPNPINQLGIINYELGIRSHVNISIYDITGRKVETIENGEMRMENVEYKINFDAGKLNNGVYFCKLQAGNMSMTKKIVVVHGF